MCDGVIVKVGTWAHTLAAPANAQNPIVIKCLIFILIV